MIRAEDKIQILESQSTISVTSSYADLHRHLLQSDTHQWFASKIKATSNQ